MGSGPTKKSLVACTKGNASMKAEYARTRPSEVMYGTMYAMHRQRSEMPKQMVAGIHAWGLFAKLTAATSAPVAPYKDRKRGFARRSARRCPGHRGAPCDELEVQWPQATAPTRGAQPLRCVWLLHCLLGGQQHGEQAGMELRETSEKMTPSSAVARSTRTGGSTRTGSSTRTGNLPTFRASHRRSMKIASAFDNFQAAGDCTAVGGRRLGARQPRRRPNRATVMRMDDGGPDKF